ncbi:MAG: SDR family oxidoreductase, partial [Angelakisella sp.]
DITNCTAVEAMIDKAIEKMGRIDILVNNAGVYPALPVLEVTEKHFDFVVDVNLKGLFFMTQAVVKKSMLPNNYGRIVNISSCDGKNPGRGVAIYSAAKAGVISITKSFALELADYDINSNAVAAGWVESEQVLANDRWKDALPSIPSRRLGKLSEIAEAVVFMCNDKVSYINGEILDVNGGIIMD